MAQERRSGRPLGELSTTLDPAVFAFAERLRVFYTNLNLTLTQLEEPLGADATTLSRYLAGKVIPERGLLNRLYQTVERHTGIAVHDDVRASTNELYYAACAVLEPQRHALYQLRDEKNAAEHRADQAEETVEELRTELRSALGLKELAEADLYQLQARYERHEQDAQAQLQKAQLRRDQLEERMRQLAAELHQALADLQVAVADRDRLVILLQQAEAKLQAEIEMRWSRDEQAPQLNDPAKAGRAVGWTIRRKRIDHLRVAALDTAHIKLPDVVRRLRDADLPDTDFELDLIPVTSDDSIGQLTHAINELQLQAVRLASEQALLRSNVNAMFVNLSRRSQALVQRQLRLINEMRDAEQDPGQLADLFKLDHLATRMRRNGENLLVLAGEGPGRTWSKPWQLLAVVQAAASEVEQYERAALRDLPDVNVLGRVVNDLVHLVAELLENATSFSAPEHEVAVTGNMLNTGGVMLEIEDAGIGMTPEELDDANERLANPPVIDVAISRRMGLYVVGRLATRHGIQVRLRRSAGGGITALVLVPSTLLAGADGEQQAPTRTYHDEGPGSPQSGTGRRRRAPGTWGVPTPGPAREDPVWPNRAG